MGNATLDTASSMELERGSTMKNRASHHDLGPKNFLAPETAQGGVVRRRRVWLFAEGMPSRCQARIRRGVMPG